MFLVEIFGSCLVLILTGLIWRNRRFIYLISKIPLSSYDVPIRSFFEAILGDTSVFFENTRKELKGKGLTASFLGSMVTINVLSPEDIKIVFNSKACVDKPSFIKKIFQGGEKGSLFGPLEIWQTHRRILNPFFGLQSLRTIVIPIFNRKVSVLLSNIEKMKGKGEFNVLHHMSALTLETIFSVMEFERDIQNQETKSRDVFIENLEK
jgi:cytochrome P450